MSYYAVANGRTKGIFYDWIECKKQVEGFKNAKFKKFNNLNDANKFLIDNGISKFHKRKLNPINVSNLPSSSAANKASNNCSKKAVQIIQDNDFSVIKYNDNGDPIVYTDGACVRNGRANSKAGIGVFWADNHPDNVSRELDGKATNNRAEIEAAIVAIQTAIKNNYKTLDIHTDSDFMINSMTTWIKKWKRNGWKLLTGEPVKNQSDWRRFDFYQSKLEKVVFTKVRGHSGVYGNEKADWLAKNGIGKYKPEKFSELLQ